MLEIILKRNIILIFALFLLLPTILIPNNIFDSIKYYILLNTGIKTDAKVVQDSMYSDVMINDVDYYYVKYIYEDQNGKAHTGYTSTCFTYNEAERVESEGVINITYNPKTFDSIESNYFSHSTNGLDFVSIFFLLIDSILWYFAIRRIIRNIRYAVIKKKGKPYTATVTNIIDTELIINDSRMCKIQYVWTDELGHQHEKTTPAEYTVDQADALLIQKTIDIKTGAKNYSIIVSEPDYSLLHNNTPTPHISESDNTTKL